MYIAHLSDKHWVGGSLKNKEKCLEPKQSDAARSPTDSYIQARYTSIVMHKSACMDGHALIGGYLFADATM